MNTITKEIDAIRLSSVEITPDRVSECDGKQTTKTIQKNEIISISLNYGTQSERTVLEVLFSIFMILMGLYLGLIPTGKFIYDIYSHTGVEGRYSSYKGLILILFPLLFILPFGIYSLLRTVQKRYYLSIKTKNDKRKIVFNDAIPAQEVTFFIHTAKEKYGYVIESNVETMLI
jgi:hypothetical protein